MAEKIVYTPEDLRDFNYQNDLGNPGEFPFTRGTRSGGYREKLWTMRMFSGFGSAKDTNKRFKYLLAEGETGLSVAFHLPTLLGLDSDNPSCAGEIGKCGVAIDSLEDMEILFDGIPLDKITTSMTINAPAIVLLAMYFAVAEKQGLALDKIGGTIQNDILKEYISQNTYIFPPEPSIRLIVDTIEYCSKYAPRWNPISISGYHIREGGATAVQELAFTLADGMTYVEACLSRGLVIDDFAPRLSFFFNLHNDFFEEIAKIRAARRIWAKLMKEKYQAKNPRSWQLRCHAQTAGCTLTYQQPENNTVRVALQALAGVLAGVQSLHTNSRDEALALPSKQAATIALRTQQIIACESRVAQTVDPLAGSYFIEFLTSQMEKEAYRYFEKIKSLGGMVSAIEKGFPQKEISDSAARYQREIEKKEKIVIGVNQFALDAPSKIPRLKIDQNIKEKQLKKLEALKASRNQEAVKDALTALKQSALGKDNLMPPILKAVKDYATVGEICNVLREVFGEYRI